MDVRNIIVKGSWMLLIPLLSPVYSNLNGSHGNVYSLVTGLDKLTPFVPQFILPYVAWYVFIFLTLIWLMLKNQRLYSITLGAIIFGLLVSFGVYSIFQTTVPRPEIVGTDIFSQLVRLVYNSDKPFNAFPSIHVLTSFIIFLVSYETRIYSRLIAWGSQVMSLLIIASTVLLKQHVLLDVAGGIILAALVYKISSAAYGMLASKEVQTWQEKPSLLSMTNVKSQS